MRSDPIRVIYVGEDPATVNYSETPPEVDEDYIRSGCAKAVADMKMRGWEAQMCYVPPQVEEAVATLKRSLAGGAVDVVLFGGGLRMPRQRLGLFEALVNEVRRSAPDAALAFDNDPGEGLEAVARHAQGR